MPASCIHDIASINGPQVAACPTFRGKPTRSVVLPFNLLQDFMFFNAYGYINPETLNPPGSFVGKTVTSTSAVRASQVHSLTRVKRHRRIQSNDVR
ncbi:MAG: hypothetical protein ACTS6P_01350 [Candidatus Hodgkinia cicadicola]